MYQFHNGHRIRLDPATKRAHNPRDEGICAANRVVLSPGEFVHTAIHLSGFWAAAFVTLSVALVLLNIFDGIIGNDLTLRSAGQEAIIAGIASLVEGGSLWLVVTFVPAGGRALIVPALIVGFIYKIGHLEDWSRYDVLMLLMFQAVIAGCALALVFGQFQMAFIVLLVFAFALALIAGFARGL